MRLSPCSIYSSEVNVNKTKPRLLRAELMAATLRLKTTSQLRNSNCSRTIQAQRVGRHGTNHLFRTGLLLLSNFYHRSNMPILCEMIEQRGSDGLAIIIFYGDNSVEYANARNHRPFKAKDWKEGRMTLVLLKYATNIAILFSNTIVSQISSGIAGVSKCAPIRLLYQPRPNSNTI